MKKYIKENKILVVAVIVFLALLVVCFVVKELVMHFMEIGLKV